LIEASEIKITLHVYTASFVRCIVEPLVDAFNELIELFLICLCALF